MLTRLKAAAPSVLVTLFAQVAAAVSMFLMHLVTARLMPISIYGSFSFGMNVGSLGALICTLGYPSLVMRAVAQHAASGEHALVKSVCVHASRRVLAGTFVAVVGFLVFVLLASNLKDDIRSGLIFASLVLLLYPIGVIRSNAARGLAAIPCAIFPEEVIRPLAFVGLLFAASGFVPVGLGVSAATFLAAGLIALATGVWCLGRKLPFVWANVSAVAAPVSWGRVSSRMLLGSVLQEVSSRSDIIALGLFTSMAATAQYTAAAKVALLSVFFLRVVDVIYAPRIAVAHAGGDKRGLARCIRNSAAITLVASSPVIIALMAVPQWFLLPFGSEFQEAASILRVLALGQLFNAATGSVGFALLMTGNEAVFARVVAFTASMNVIGHLVFTTSFGIMGAAWVTAVSVAFQNTAMLFQVYRKLFANG